ncbi:putative ribonuclease H-like domain-containing protein, partial [Tanacetum coccineum]
MLQFKLQIVWILVDLPFGKKAIGIKWVFRNKRDERSIVVKNKARLVAQGFRQEEGIDYDEVFALVVRIEAIMLFLAFASFMGFPVYQMDVKSAFLYSTIEEEVYVHQPLGFVDPAHLNKVYKVIKALYGLHKLLELDDIIFGFTTQSMCSEFEDCMHKRFQMSSMGELTFFLGLQAKQQPNEIFVSQDKYIADILKKFDFCSIKTATNPIVSNKPLVKDEDGVDVDVHIYRSMIGPLMYLTASSPDIMFVVCACARFQVTPKASHLNAVKRIFRLRATYDAELVSAASLVNTARPTLSTARLGKFGAVRKGVKFSGKVPPLFDSMLVPHQAPKGEGSEQSTKPQPTPSPTQPSIGDQPPETSSSHATTQDSRDSLKGTNRNEGDQFITDAQAAEISALKSRIKKLEKKCKPSISHHRAWLKSVHKLSMKKRFRNKESVSKHGRKKSKPESTLDDSTVFKDQDADHAMEYIETKEAGNGDKRGNAEELVSTARPEVSTARPDINAARQEDSAVEPRTPPTTTSIFDDEDTTMAQTLIMMKEEKAKEKGVSFKDIKDSSRLERSILTLKPLPTIDPNDKGKRDAEIARQLQVDLQAEEEREEYTIEERAKFLAETIDAQRKFRAAQRSAKIRSRPPTKSQLRNLMMTYLKNMGGYKHSELKEKSFEEIKGMHERQKKSVQDFVPIGSTKEEELIKKMNEMETGKDTLNKEKVIEEPDSTKVEVKQEGHGDSTRKRPGRRLKMKAIKKSKRKKINSDLEEEEQLKAFLMIVHDEEGII